MSSHPLKSLALLRHAKSDWENSTLADIDRPLTPRGVKAAARIGEYLRALGFWPDLILCSSARRTQDTVTEVRAAWPAERRPAAPLISKALYLCGAPALCAAIQGVPAHIDRVLVVAHNPDLHDLAVTLTGTGDARRRAKLADKFPTAALALISFAGSGWDQVRPGAGTLQDFVQVRDLP